MKRLTLIILIISTTVALCAQHTVTGTVIDAATGDAVEMAAVQLFRYHGSDSTMTSGAQTDTYGTFTLSDIPDGRYKAIISSLGYKTLRLNVQVKHSDTNLGTLQFHEDALLLQEVTVKGRAVEMTVKGDTLEYNAGAFATTDNAMVEELLKKMPGVEISTDGTVTVNGEQIKAIRVDGKKFFGDDLQSATKNIPADMIDKIQVIDQQSEMSRLTGFEDDETERIINLTLKKEKKHGVFGNFNGAIGADLVADNGKWFGYHQDPRTPAQDTKAFFNDEFRYNAGAFVNILTGTTQTTLIGSANNTNEARTGRGRGYSSSPNSGITWAENIGANISAEPTADTEIGGNASATHTNNITNNRSRQETYTGTDTYYNTDTASSQADNWDTNLRFEIEHKIDTANKIIVQPSLSYTHTNRIAADNYSYRTADTTITTPTSSGWQNTLTKSRQIQGGVRATYSHSFRKTGRKLTMRANININNTTANETDIYKKYSYGILSDNINQIINRNNTNYTYSLRTSYVEPLVSKRHLLETVLDISASDRHSDKTQHALDTITGQYTILDSAYSSNFNNRFFSEALELNYMYKHDDYNITAGIKINPAQTLVEQVYTSGSRFDTVLSVWNFAPSFSFKYKFGKKQFARIQYNGTPTQPTINQMQPSADNSNSMSVRAGNLNLNPAFTHNLRFMFSKYNSETMASITAGLRASLTKDALVNNTVYDLTGKAYRQTVNAQSLPWNINGDIMYSTPLANRWLTLNTRTALSYNNQIAYLTQQVSALDIDIRHLPLGKLSQTGNLRAQQDLSLRLAHSIADAGLKLAAAYSRTQNTNTTNATNVVNWTLTADVIFHLPKNWNISTDIGYTGRYGYNLSDINEIMWNISIDKTVLNGAGTVSLKAYDLLNQKKNIVETIGENYVKYAKYNTLPTYFLISFTYKLNRMGDLQAKGRSARMIEQIEKGPNGPASPNSPNQLPPPPPDER